MICRNDCIEDLRREAREHLIKEFRSKPEYKQTLKNLIVQVSVFYCLTLLKGHDQVA